MNRTNLAAEIKEWDERHDGTIRAAFTGKDSDDQYRFVIKCERCNFGQLTLVDSDGMIKPNGCSGATPGTPCEVKS